MSNIETLRKQAKALGYRIHRRGAVYRVMNTRRGGIISKTGFTTDDLYVVEALFNAFEGKIPAQYTTACGMPISNNAEAVAKYHSKQRSA
jgi:hypothetical protein